MCALFLQPKLRKPKDDPRKPQKEYILEILGSNTQLFQDWVQQQTDEQLWEYFNRVSEGIAAHNLEHYNFKLCNGRWNHSLGAYDKTWHIEVYYGENESAKEGPLQVARCMSCDLDCPLIRGVLGEAAAAAIPPTQAVATLAAAPAASRTTVSTEAIVPAGLPPGAAETDSNDAAAVCDGATAEAALNPPRIEQQQQQQECSHQEAGARVEVASSAEPGRAAAGSTPHQKQLQHPGPVSRDSLVKETEHCRVWWDAKARPMWVVTPKRHVERLSSLSQAELTDLFRTAVAVVHGMGCSSFQTMILNHGDSRNHAHLHLKVRIFWKEFGRIRSLLAPRLQEQLTTLERFRDQLPPEAQGTKQAWQLRQQGWQQRQQQGQHQRQRRC